MPAPDTTTAPGTLDPLGPRFVTVGSGASVSFDVPAGTFGFLLSESVESLRAPDGRYFVQNTIPLGCSGAQADPCTFYSYRGGAPLTGATLSFPTGSWTAAPIYFEEPKPVVLQLQGTTDGKFHGGVSDLYLYIPEGLRISAYTPTSAHSVVNAANATSHPVLKAVVDKYFQLTKRLLGLDRGKVVFTDVEARFRTLQPKPDGSSEADGLAARNQAKVGLHVVLMERLTGNAVGLAPVAAPLAPSVGGHTVLVQTTEYWGSDPSAGPPEDVEALARDIATTMLHEAGHLWGLLHVGGTLDDEDPLGDTPECSTSDSSQACFAKAGKYVMYPAVTEVPLAELMFSPQQVQVLRGAPSYFPYASSQGFSASGHSSRASSRGAGAKGRKMAATLRHRRRHPNLCGNAIIEEVKRLSGISHGLRRSEALRLLLPRDMVGKQRLAEAMRRLRKRYLR